MQSSVAALMPPLREWFSAKFPGLTDIQRKALPHTLRGANTLILAPTGSGKTLAAFLAVLSRLGELASAGTLPNAVCAIYVSPLKSLGNDMRRNVSEPLRAINAGLPDRSQIRMELRTGDTGAKERGRQARKPPHLLLTTPESLSTLLSQTRWREKGFAPRWVIVDEIHAVAENKRGSLLSLALERLEARAPAPLQRIGLSATAWPVDAVTRFLCGDRPCVVAAVDVRKAHQLEIATPAPDISLPPAGHNPFRIAQPVAELIEKASCSLVFTSTRSAAERLTLALKVLLPQWEEVIAVHHGSIDRAARLEIESGLAAGSLKAVVCSSSLELGVDFAAVDQVLLIGAPRGVSRTLQRLGRSGHRVDGVARGALAPLSLPDLLECVALRRAATTGRLDVLRVPEAPLDVLAQTLLGMSIERPWPVDEAFALLRCAGPYRDLTRKDFDAVLEYLAGGGPVLSANEAYGKIVLRDGCFAVASAKAARAFYMNAGVISDDFQMKVVTRAHRRLGEVEENFLAELRPGDAFVIAGKTVAVQHMFQDTAVVAPASGERVQTPRWMGGKMPLSARLAREQLALRRDLRKSWEEGSEAAVIRRLRSAWSVPKDAALRIAGFIERQNRAAPVPIDSPVQVETIRSRRTLLLLFHVVAGRAINRSLAWVLAHRIAAGGSAVANFDDHSFLLSLDVRKFPGMERLRECFNPDGWLGDLRSALSGTETLGRRFRAVAEVGQLLPRRTLRGNVSVRSSTWSASLLYTTLREHEPDHPLVREAIREVLEDDCDAETALYESRRIYQAPWETLELPRPSPFGLPLFAAFNRETLLAQDADKALDDLVASLYDEWENRV